MLTREVPWVGQRSPEKKVGDCVVMLVLVISLGT